MIEAPHAVVTRPYVIRLRKPNFSPGHEVVITLDPEGRCCRAFEEPGEFKTWQRAAFLQDILAPQRFVHTEWIPDTDCFLEIE